MYFYKNLKAFICDINNSYWLMHSYTTLVIYVYEGLEFNQDKYKHFIVIPTGSHFKIIKLVHSIHVTHIWTFPKYLEISKYSDILSATQRAYRTP